MDRFRDLHSEIHLFQSAFAWAIKRRIKVDDLGIQVGRARHFQNIRLTAECDSGCVICR